MCVRVIEQFKEALVDHVLCHIHSEQREHVLEQVRDVLHMAPPVRCLCLVEPEAFTPPDSSRRGALSGRWGAGEKSGLLVCEGVRV